MDEFAAILHIGTAPLGSVRFGIAETDQTLIRPQAVRCCRILMASRWEEADHQEQRKKRKLAWQKTKLGLSGLDHAFAGIAAQPSTCD